MKDSKLILLLKSLDATAFKGLHLFLKSPYYNRNEHVTNLYEYLAEHYPAFRSPYLLKETTFQSLFPGSRFDLNKMRKLMSALTQLVETYLGVLEFERTPFVQKKLLAAAYSRRDLRILFEKEIWGLIAGLQEAPNRDRAYYYELLLLNLELFFHPDTDKKKVGRELLEQAMEQLDSFYALTKLQIGAEMLTRENILAERYSIRLLDEVVQESTQSFAPNNPLYQVYLDIIGLHQDSAGIVRLAPSIALFKNMIPNVAIKEQQAILHHLINHCIRLINQGEIQYKQELFELYELGIEHKLLLENNHIAEITFSNIVATGASLKAFDWTRDFMDTYAVFLGNDVREDIYALSLGLWHFSKKEYDQIGPSLQSHVFSDMLNLIKSRCLLIRTYFEQFLLDNSSYPFLISQIESFEKSVRRNKKIAKHKSKAYLNFIILTKKLAQIRYNKQNSAKLRQQLGTIKVVSYKEWLLEKMEGT